MQFQRVKNFQFLPSLLMAFAIATLLGAGAQAQTLISSIDQKTGWQSCSACAGAGGTGSVATYSLAQSVATPSMDGSSAQFNLGGSTPYSNALWWKQLGAHSSAANFVYDVYYYIKTPTAAQALEFDVNQSRYSKKYIFGTECDFKGTHTWHVYDAYNHKWVSTSVGCKVPAAYTWNHVVLEFHRTSTGTASFIAVTINGVKAYFSKAYAPRATSSDELNVAFQMDGNKSQTDYSVWLDKLNFKYW